MSRLDQQDVGVKLLCTCPGPPPNWEANLQEAPLWHLGLNAWLVLSQWLGLRSFFCPKATDCSLCFRADVKVQQTATLPWKQSGKSGRTWRTLASLCQQTASADLLIAACFWDDTGLVRNRSILELLGIVIIKHCCDCLVAKKNQHVGEFIWLCFCLSLLVVSRTTTSVLQQLTQVDNRDAPG